LIRHYVVNGVPKVAMTTLADFAVGIEFTVSRDCTITNFFAQPGELSNCATASLGDAARHPAMFELVPRIPIPAERSLVLRVGTRHYDSNDRTAHDDRTAAIGINFRERVVINETIEVSIVWADSFAVIANKNLVPKFANWISAGPSPDSGIVVRTGVEGGGKHRRHGENCQTIFRFHGAPVVAGLISIQRSRAVKTSHDSFSDARARQVELTRLPLFRVG
jgi:hypothetical protein